MKQFPNEHKQTPYRNLVSVRKEEMFIYPVLKKQKPLYSFPNLDYLSMGRTQSFKIAIVSGEHII